MKKTVKKFFDVKFCASYKLCIISPNAHSKIDNSLRKSKDLHIKYAQFGFSDILF